MPKTNLLKATINEQDCVPIDEAYRILGRGFSRRSILRYIEAEYFIEGIHWVNDAPPSSKKRNIKINLEAIRRLRATPTHQR
ncbi:MAG: hypothetical protein KME29_04825 [Calothrix sp. FI2-JRJ7]|jgi:hypothetical protein|nr:hypothetical protein [Calothrix sp. FI2-JRJ7]